MARRYPNIQAAIGANFVAVPADFAQAKEVQAQLWAEHERTGRHLHSISGGGLMGMTPEHVRVTPEWQKAKRETDAAFAALRAFNEVYVRRFKKELAKERSLKRGRTSI